MRASARGIDRPAQYSCAASEGFELGVRELPRRRAISPVLTSRSWPATSSSTGSPAPAGAAERQRSGAGAHQAQLGAIQSARSHHQASSSRSREPVVALALATRLPHRRRSSHRRRPKAEPAPRIGDGRGKPGRGRRATPIIGATTRPRRDRACAPPCSAAQMSAHRMADRDWGPDLPRASRRSKA